MRIANLRTWVNQLITSQTVQKLNPASSCGRLPRGRPLPSQNTVHFLPLDGALSAPEMDSTRGTLPRRNGSRGEFLYRSALELGYLSNAVQIADGAFTLGLPVTTEDPPLGYKANMWTVIYICASAADMSAPQKLSTLRNGVLFVCFR